MHPKYAKILNIAMFLIWQGSQNASFTQNSEYARRCLDKVLNILNMQLHMVLNMPSSGQICQNRMWICSDMLEYVWIYDNKKASEYVSYNKKHRSLYKLMSTYWEIGIFKTCLKIWDGALWKNNCSF